MPLRDLLVFFAVVLLLPMSFRRPFIGLLLFSWLAYMRPQDLCWGFARGMRFSFYVATTMIVGWWVNESHRRKFIKPEIRSYLLIALAVLISVSLLFARAYSATTFRYYFEFLKIIVIALFTLSQVDTKAKIRMLLWVICASLSFYAVKNGLLGFLRGGSVILRGPGGMLEDNNDFALALVMNIPLLWYLRSLEDNKWLDRACVAAIFLTMVTVMLTHSRGGFLAMSMTVLWILYRSGRIFQAGMSGLAMVGMFFLFAPAHVIERVLSITAGRTDSSVASRLDSWALALRMFADNPVWGVGLRNFVDNADRYGRVEAGATFVHVAHNSFLQIAAEGGGLAFIVYMTILCSVFWSCNWMRRVARVREDLAWAGVYASMFEAINIGFLVGGTFLNRGHFDLIYHFVSLVGCVTLIVRAEVVSRTQVARSTRDAGVIRVRWRSPLAMGAMPRWERST